MSHNKRSPRQGGHRSYDALLRHLQNKHNLFRHPPDRTGEKAVSILTLEQIHTGEHVAEHKQPVKLERIEAAE